MRVDQSDIPYELEDVYILQSGIHYFFKDFIISEVNEGVLYTWDVAQDLISIALDHYGDESEISLISNRINSYSVVPQDWLKFFSSPYKHRLKAFAVVSYSKPSSLNVLMEKMFFKSKIRKFYNLYEALDWVTQNAPILRKGKSHAG